MRAYTGITAKKDMAGCIFGSLTVIKECEKRNQNGHILYLCECVCGKQKEILGSSLRSGSTKSCCFLSSNTHGQSNTSEYKIWSGIKNRCLNTEAVNYPKYGGRGIKVCDRWIESFENFISDMGKKPTNQHSIDRINVNGNYEPSNCRWATAETQARNRRNNLLFEIKGEVKCISEWSKIYRIPISTINNRIKRGWDVSLSVTHPIKIKHRKGSTSSNT